MPLSWPLDRYNARIDAHNARHGNCCGAFVVVTTRGDRQFNVDYSQCSAWWLAGTVRGHVRCFNMSARTVSHWPNSHMDREVNAFLSPLPLSRHIRRLHGLPKERCRVASVVERVRRPTLSGTDHRVWSTVSVLSVSVTVCVCIWVCVLL